MLVLGKNPNEKGEQLETLTLDLLKSLTYVNCTTNIMTGGAEIDVKGQLPLPGPAGTRFQSLICECKAHRTVVDMTQWNKFLGKIFFQEASENQEVGGCFIALSGVNGHVQGNYDELCQHRHTVSLLQGDAILSAIARICPLSLPQQFSDSVRCLTQRVVMRYEAAYYNKTIYWVVIFDHSDFTILSGVGTPLDRAVAEPLVPMVQGELEAQNYIDLQVEALAQRRAAMAKAIVLGTLFEQDGSVPTIEVLTDLAVNSTMDANVDALSVAEASRAASVLIQDSLVATEESSGRCFIPTTEQDGVSLVAPEVYRILLSGGCRVSVLGCRYYDEHINSALLREICKIQANLPLEESHRDKAIQLLRWSPMALLRAVQPMPLLTQKGVDRTVPSPIDKFHVDYFFRTLFDSFRNEFGESALNRYYYEIRQLRELEICSQIKVKSEAAVALQDEVCERYRIAPADKSFGGGLVTVLLVNSAPQPWEPFWNPQPPSGDKPGDTKKIWFIRRKRT